MNLADVLVDRIIVPRGNRIVPADKPSIRRKRVEAGEAYIVDGEPAKDVAARNGITEQTLKRWAEAAKEYPEASPELAASDAKPLRRGRPFDRELRGKRRRHIAAMRCYLILGHTAKVVAGHYHMSVRSIYRWAAQVAEYADAPPELRVGKRRKPEKGTPIEPPQDN